MHKEPNYLYLMLSMLVTVVLITSARPQSAVAILGVFVGVFSLMMVSAYVMARRRAQMLVAVLLGSLAFLPFAWMNFNPELLAPQWAKGVYILNLSFWLLFTSYVGIVVLRSILAARHIRRNEIFGAIYLYLVIGVLFAELYQMLLVWQPDALYFDPARFPESAALAHRLFTRGTGDVLYYSFVTLGTVGYGDVTPATPIARALSLVEMLTGVLYVATMISRFVSIQTTDETRRAENDGGT
jgi:hypothetical protein